MWITKRITGYIVLGLILASFIVLSGCGKSDAEKNEKVFNGAPGIYLPPPQGHLNPFITNAINMGIYVDFVEQSLGFYNWKEEKWVPILATDWTLDQKANEYVVHLRQGVKFHDGSDFTAKDVVSTFYLTYLMNQTVWQKKYIDKVYARDKYTVVFHVKNPYSVIERFILRTTLIRPYSVYGKFSDRIMTWADEEIYIKDVDENIRKYKTVNGLNEAVPADLIALIKPYAADTAEKKSPERDKAEKQVVKYLQGILKTRPAQWAAKPANYEEIEKSSRAKVIAERKAKREGKPAPVYPAPTPEQLLSNKLAALLKEALDAQWKPIKDKSKVVRNELNAFRPEYRYGTGPFMLSMKDVNESQLTLRKFKDYWGKENILFDKVILYNGETPTITPMLMANELDYATHGFPIATERQLSKMGFRIMRPPTYAGVAVGCNNNEKSYPLNKREVRQALAYLINRDETAFCALGYAAKPYKYLSGFSDSLVSKWMSPEAISHMNQYPHSLAKAEALLKEAGCQKKNGWWYDDRGKRIQWDLMCILEYADWASAAENIVLQMRKFGLDVSLRAVNATQWPTEMNQGRYDMTIRACGASQPHPSFAYEANYITYNDPEGKLGPGMEFPLIQDVPYYGQLNLEDLVKECSIGFDLEGQKRDIEQLAVAQNYYLPIIPVYERYGNSPLLENKRIEPLPKDSSYYQNALYSDNFMVIMMFDGTLRPKGTAGKAGK